MKSIREADLKNKKVIVRVDYNCRMENGDVKDTTRIKASLDTINYLVENNAKIILLSHAGKVKTESDKENYSLKSAASYLSRMVNTNVYFINETRGNLLETTIEHMKEKEIVVVENTRFEDVPSNYESSCDEELSKYWASLGDVFVLDAFSSAHRNHASTYGISKYLPSFAGLLIYKEKELLDKIINEDNTFVLGGSKVEDKIKIIENLLPKTDKLLLGGAMCFTFLKAQNYNTGKCYIETSMLDKIKTMLEENKDKIILPVDFLTENGPKELKDLEENDIAYDIGPKTVELFNSKLSQSKLILCNGPLGKYEEETYEFGTRKVLEYLSNNKNKETILAGGDIIAAANKFGFEFENTATGGGATLKYLEGKSFDTFERLNG